MSQPRLALVSYGCPTFVSADDALSVPALTEAGFVVSFVSWDDPSVPWTQFEVVVLRSCWDYHERYREFVSWLERLDLATARLINPARSIVWNANKRYLLDLQRRGVRIVPTHYLNDGELPSRELLRRLGFSQAVIKPAISASAAHTELVSESTIGAIALPRGQQWIVQRFVSSITHQGEWSLIFFNGVYSHAVLKKPRSGDFRVQSALGGSWEPCTASTQMVEFASRVLRAVDDDLTYARVDCVVDGDDIALMELEIIEPSLFFQADTAAPGRFAHAISQRAAAQRGSV